MTLTTQKTVPKTNLWEYPIFIYGVPKIGKSTLAAEIPDNLFFNTAGGLDALSVFEEKINTWEEFKAKGAEFIAGDHKFGVLTIDTIDRLHKLCVDFMCKKLNIIHPQDLDFGKGYDMVKDEFIRPLTKLALSKYGLIMISHVREVETTTRVRKFTKSIPTLQNHIWEMIDGLSGIILFYTQELSKDGITKRFIKTAPNEEWIAGDRTRKLIVYGDIEMTLDGTNWQKIENIFNGTLQKGDGK